MFPYAEGETPVDWGRVTIALILVNTFVFVGEAAGVPWPYRDYLAFFAFWPGRPTWYTWLTSLFLHGDFFHLLGNMWALWIFGHRVEMRLGRWYLPLYLCGGLFANAAMLMADPGGFIPTLGASGAIASVIAAYAVLFPRNRLRFWGMNAGFTASAALFGLVWLGMEWTSFHGDPTGRLSGVAHGAHVGGALAGLGAALLLKEEGVEEGPTTGAGDIAAALAAGRDALAPYLSDLRAGLRPALSPAQALAVADGLSDGGLPHLARGLLSGALAGDAGDAQPAARLLLGYVCGSQLGCLSDSAAAYAAVVESAAASQAQRDDALQRLKRTEAVLARVAFEDIRADEPAWLLHEGSVPLAPEQRDEVDEKLAAAGIAASGAAGVFAVNQPAGRLIACARALQACGIAAVVTPARSSVAPAKPVLVDEVAVREGGLVLGGRIFAPWRDIALIAAFQAQGERFMPSDGVLDVSMEDSMLPGGEIFSQAAPKKELRVVAVPTLDIVAVDGKRRWRWQEPDESLRPADCLSRLRATCLALAADRDAPALNDAVGSLAAGFHLPPSCDFGGLEIADIYVTWQAQLARVRRLAASLV